MERQSSNVSLGRSVFATYSEKSCSESDLILPIDVSVPDPEHALQHQKSLNSTVLIAVFGATGTGKSTFIKNVSGKDVLVGHNLKSCMSWLKNSHKVCI